MTARGEAIAGSIEQILDLTGRGVTAIARQHGRELLDPSTCRDVLQPATHALGSLTNLHRGGLGGLLGVLGEPPVGR